MNFGNQFLYCSQIHYRLLLLRGPELLILITITVTVFNSRVLTFFALPFFFVNLGGKRLLSADVTLPLPLPWSGRAKRETAKGRNQTWNAHFCRFSLIFGSPCKSRDLGVADWRRKPRETADFRRKPQIFAETGFSHLLSPFWRAPTWPCFYSREFQVYYRYRCDYRRLFQKLTGKLNLRTGTGWRAFFRFFRPP